MCFDTPKKTSFFQGSKGSSPVMSCPKNQNAWVSCLFLVVGGLILVYGFQLSIAARTPVVPAIVVFGDSTVDAGNNNNLETVVKSNFPPYGRDFDTEAATGRFCNGRLPTDYIALLAGVAFPPAYLDPEVKGEKIVQGVCFASAASGYYDGTAQNFNVISLTKQLSFYQDYLQKLAQVVGPANASSIISKALFILSTGSNDYVNNYYINLPLQKQYNTAQYQDILLNSYQNFIQVLYKSGARRIGIVSMPPLGCLPSQISIYGEGSTKCIEFQNMQALSFNQGLQEATQMLKSSSPGLRIAVFDIYTILMNAVHNPEQYGFSHTVRGCCGVGRLAVAILCNQLTPGTCSNATSYVFWDSFHPSDYMNSIIAHILFPQGVRELID